LGVIGLFDSFARFAVQGVGTPAPVFPTCQTQNVASDTRYLDTLFGLKRVWELHHFYQHGSVPNTFFIGKGDPANILAYLQFRAEKEIDMGCLLFHTDAGAAKLLQRFYGYRIAPFKSKRNAVWIDLYEAFASGDAASGFITSLPGCFTAARVSAPRLKSVFGFLEHLFRRGKMASLLIQLYCGIPERCSSFHVRSNALSLRTSSSREISQSALLLAHSSFER
jgi:hypothetical protein